MPSATWNEHVGIDKILRCLLGQKDTDRTFPGSGHANEFDVGRMTFSLSLPGRRTEEYGFA